MSEHGDGVHGPNLGTDALRLRWLTRSDNADESQILRGALQQAVAALGGLGGMAHLVTNDEATLGLVAMSGVPMELARRWELLDLSADSRTAPVRVTTNPTPAWSTALPAGAAGQTGTGPSPRHPAGVLSAPIVVAGATIGALSVLADEEPAPDRRRFLAQVTDLVGGQLPEARRWLSGATPWWRQPLGARMMREVSVGTWSWHLPTGLLDFDEAAEELLRLAGLEPDAWDRHIEGWMARIHPDDLSGVQEAIQKSHDHGSPYAVEYRVVGTDGRISWLELRGVFEREATGTPVRMVGTAWNVSTRRSREAWLVGQQERDPDPLLVVSPENQVVWGNRAAVGLTVPPGAALIGRAPWEAIPALAGGRMPELLDRARASSGVAAKVQIDTFDPARGENVHHRVRAVEIDGFVSVRISDVTEATRIERAAAARDHALAGLTNALLRALTVDDVVAAVTTHLASLVAAEGLIVHDLTGPAPRLAGHLGYSRACLEPLEKLDIPRFLDAENLTTAPELVESLDELARTWPALASFARHTGHAAWAVLPLVAGERLVGSCIISWSTRRSLGADVRALLGVLGVTVGQALMNAGAFDEAKRRAERLQRELTPRPASGASPPRATRRRSF